MYQYSKATYAVMGNPIAHSKSPLIHGLFAQQTGDLLDYLALYVEQGQFVQAVQAFQAANGLGLNITVPFKQEAWQLATQKTERAELAGAVNTLWFEGDEIHGDNTDGVGLVQDLSVNKGISLQNKRILLLGAGGAVRGVLKPLLDSLPANITIANRSLSKAQALLPLYPQQPLTACRYEDLQQLDAFDVIINGTSMGLQGNNPPVSENSLHPQSQVYDMLYANEDTPFVTWGKQHGVSSYDGLGMLVEQAAAAFHIWRQQLPDTAQVITQLRCG